VTTSSTPAQRELALADLRSARIDAWAATGHQDPEAALVGDTHREAARALGPPSAAEREAAHRVAVANDGLVRRCCARLIRQRPELAEDILQDGRIGLLRAIDRYDHRPIQFSTVAYWWIRQSVVRELLDHGELIRIPVGSHTLRRRIRSVRDQLPDATQAQIAKRIGASISAVRRIDSCALRAVVSDEYQLATEDDIDALLDLSRASAVIEGTLAKSSDRDGSIFRRIVYDEMSPARVGEEFAITRQRVCQIYSRVVSAIYREASL